MAKKPPPAFLSKSKGKGAAAPKPGRTPPGLPQGMPPGFNKGGKVKGRY